MQNLLDGRQHKFDGRLVFGADPGILKSGKCWVWAEVCVNTMLGNTVQYQYLPNNWEKKQSFAKYCFQT